MPPAATAAAYAKPTKSMVILTAQIYKKNYDFKSLFELKKLLDSDDNAQKGDKPIC